MKRKVCFVSTFAYPLFNPNCSVTFGGSEVQSYLLAKELAKDEGFDVYMIVGDFGQSNKEKYENVTVVKSYPLDKKIWNYIQAPFILYERLQQVNPDVIIQRSASPETGICGFFSTMKNIPFIYSIAHEMDVNGDFASKGVFGLMYNYGLESADYLIAQNNEQVNLLHEWKGKSQPNIQVIKSGYEIEESNSQQEFILWVGRSDKWKRPKTFIRLARDNPSEKFVMIMPKSSNENLWEDISKKAKQRKNIEFIEQVPFHEIDSYFRKAKLFVNTSSGEGFPNTFIQACKHGTPILSLTVNPDNFLHKHNCGYSCDDKYAELNKRLNEILSNKKRYTNMSENAITYAKKNHDIRTIIEKWKKIITDIS